MAAAQLIFLVSSLPYLSGYAVRSTERDFAGGLHSRSDYAVYISMTRYGQQRHWEYHSQFTSEPHQGAYMRLFYVAAGNLSRWLGLDPVLMFHLLRWILGALVYLSLYALIGRLFSQINWRKYTFLLTATGAGAGWLQALTTAGARPVDFLFADGYVFFSNVTFPHYLAVTFAILASIAAFLDYLEHPQFKHLLTVVFLGELMQFINPITLVLVDLAILGAIIAQVTRRQPLTLRSLAAITGIGLAQLPHFVYNALILSRDPFWSRFTAQNAVPSPPFTEYLWGYGLFWILLPFGIIAAKRKQDPLAAGLLSWLAGALLLAYGPFPIQMRFLHAYVVPLGLTGALGLKEIVFPWLRKHLPPTLATRTRLIAFALLLLSSISSAKVSLGDALFLYTHPESIFFEPKTLTAAVDWLGSHSGTDDLVLGAERTSQWAAIRRGRPVYLGHLFETLDYQDKRKDIADFYQNLLPDGWLNDQRILWVIYGPHEHEYAPNFAPSQEMKLVYENIEVRIWQVRP